MRSSSLCKLVDVVYSDTSVAFNHAIIQQFPSATLELLVCRRQLVLFTTVGRGGLVVTRLPAAREDRGSRRAAGKSLCFHENHCDTQLWARAAH